MASSWYYLSNGTKYGPVSPATLKGLAQSGHLLKADLVWKEGLPDWTQAQMVKGLFDATPTTRDPLTDSADAQADTRPATGAANLTPARCPHCLRVLAVSGPLAGNAVLCPYCKKTFRASPARPIPVVSGPSEQVESQTSFATPTRHRSHSFTSNRLLLFGIAGGAALFVALALLIVIFNRSADTQGRTPPAHASVGESRDGQSPHTPSPATNPPTRLADDQPTEVEESLPSTSPAAKPATVVKDDQPREFRGKFLDLDPFSPTFQTSEGVYRLEVSDDPLPHAKEDPSKLQRLLPTNFLGLIDANNLAIHGHILSDDPRVQKTLEECVAVLARDDASWADRRAAGNQISILYRVLSARGKPLLEDEEFTLSDEALAAFLQPTSINRELRLTLLWRLDAADAWMEAFVSGLKEEAAAIERESRKLASASVGFPDKVMANAHIVAIHGMLSRRFPAEEAGITASERRAILEPNEANHEERLGALLKLDLYDAWFSAEVSAVKQLASILRDKHDRVCRANLPVEERRAINASVTRYLLVREFDSSSKAFPAIVEAVLREDSSASFVLEGRREGYVQDSVMTIYSIALAE